MDADRTAEVDSAARLPARFPAGEFALSDTSSLDPLWTPFALETYRLVTTFIVVRCVSRGSSTETVLWLSDVLTRATRRCQSDGSLRSDLIRRSCAAVRIISCRCSAIWSSVGNIAGLF